MRIRTGNELIILNILALLLITVIIFSPSNVLQIILGLPFMLFFPGYVLMAALFPRKIGLDSVERVALSFGLSIVVVSLIGLILNYTPWGIRLYPIIISVTTFIFIISAIAWYRRRKLAEGERVSVSFKISLLPWKQQNGLDKLLSIVLMAAILGAMATVGLVIAEPKIGDEFTEFYVLGLEGKAADYPQELALGEKGKVIVGIVGHEGQTMSYRVEVRIDGVTQSEMGPIVLGHEEKWENEVSFTPEVAGNNQEVEFVLYREGQTEPFLQPLRLWVDVKE